MPANKLDFLIYQDIQDIEEGDIRLLSYEDEGFTDSQVQTRLKELASAGAINIELGIGQVGVVGVSERGHAHFKSLELSNILQGRMKDSFFSA